MLFRAVEDKGTIDVGTHAQTPNDVVENGVAHIEWSVARPSVVLKEDVRSTLFFVSTSEESAKVHFSAPVITVTPPNAMQVCACVPLAARLASSHAHRGDTRYATRIGGSER